MSFVGDIVDGLTGKTAARASESAAQTSAGAQREALDYLKEVNAPALEARNFGLTGLLDFYGDGQADFIEGVKASPFYESMINQGEEAVLRNAAATGGIRGGAVQPALAQNSQNVLQNLVNQRLMGLQGLTGYNTGANQVAGMTAGIGETLAQGQVGAAQAQQMGLGNLLKSGITGLGLFL